MSLLILRLVAAVAACSIAAPVFAEGSVQARAEGGAMTLPQSAADLDAWVDRIFQRLDADRDGQITGAELRVLSQGDVAARGGARIRGLAARSDANNDARITRDELSAGAARMFARLDANGDGRLSQDEAPPPSPSPSRAPGAFSLPGPEPEPMGLPGMDED